MHAYIFNIQRFSIHDGPGIRTTVFFQGCPLQCIWCHNPEGIPQYFEKQGAEEDVRRILKYSPGMLLKEVLRDKVFFEESGGGVTLSGGEPLMQSGFLLHFIEKLKKENIHVTVDTSGYAPHDIFRKVCEMADLILFDIKLIDNEKHALYTGTKNQPIHENLEYLTNQSTPFRVRIPLINEITATEDNLEEIVTLLRGKNNISIDLLSYHNLGAFKQQKPGLKRTKNIKLTAPSPEQLQEIHSLLTSNEFDVSFGG